MKQILDYQPPQVRRRFNPQFVAGFGAGFMVGLIASSVFVVLAMLVFSLIR